MKTNLKIIATAIVIWILRVAVILPFLNEEGGFTLEAGKGLPLIVDYFFSTLFFVMIALMFVVTYWFLPKSSEQSYAKTGLNITLLFFATFIVVDLIVEIGVFKRTFLGYIESVFIDYSPLLIPYFTGLIVQKIQSKN